MSDTDEQKPPGRLSLPRTGWVGTAIRGAAIQHDPTSYDAYVVAKIYREVEVLRDKTLPINPPSETPAETCLRAFSFRVVDSSSALSDSACAGELAKFADRTK